MLDLLKKIWNFISSLFGTESKNIKAGDHSTNIIGDIKINNGQIITVDDEREELVVKDFADK